LPYGRPAFGSFTEVKGKGRTTGPALC